MITYKTQITSMTYVPTVSGFTDVVINITWNRYANENIYSTARTYTTTYTIQDINPETYIPYQDLTEATVINWVESSVNLVEVDLGMANEIAKQQAIPTVTTFPWNSAN
jgi:hypothetical protein